MTQSWGANVHPRGKKPSGKGPTETAFFMEMLEVFTTLRLIVEIHEA